MDLQRFNLMYEVKENFITNVDDIMELVEKHELDNKFTNRGIGGTDKHATIYGESCFASLYEKDMEEELVETVWKTIPDERQWCSQIVVNRYQPGDWLIRHQDSAGGYWKFKLVFLTEGKPHFKYWDKEEKEHLVQEKKGAMFEMPISTWHEVTKIKENEDNKYSLCLIWE
tara:strand:- start:13386 stop:13898 length:513 start_codon:yes stop_codon:yes gene_type:complete